MSVLICSLKYGGCGFIGETTNFKTYGEGEEADLVICPRCGEDHVFQLTRENFNELTESCDEYDFKKAQNLLIKEDSGFFD